MENSIEKLLLWQNENNPKEFEVVVVNTLIEAPGYFQEYLERFKNSRLEQSKANFINWLETVIPIDTKYELLNDKTLIFKGAIEADKLSTKKRNIPKSKK
jgi:hypothetical protein